MYKDILSIVAIIITIYAFFPYIKQIVTNVVTAHTFSWVIWGLTTSIVFFAQIQDKGGVGALITGVSGAISIGIAILAFTKRGDGSITKIDWAFFIVALSSIPFWYFTSNPMWAVVVLTTVDLLGFGPTIRKAYDNPHKESIFFFLLFVIRNIIATIALENYTITTVLFPVATALSCLLLISIIVFRRKVVAADVV